MSNDNNKTDESPNIEGTRFSTLGLIRQPKRQSEPTPGTVETRGFFQLPDSEEEQMRFFAGE